MTKTTGLIDHLAFLHRERLLKVGRDIRFAPNTRIFEKGETATRFWVISSGTVRLDTHVPGHRHAVVETLGPGDLLGCSWLFHPYRWRLGAGSVGSVQAVEFDAATVRRMCRENPDFGHALLLRCVEIIAGRLHAARLRALQPDSPHGAYAPQQGVSQESTWPRPNTADSAAHGMPAGSPTGHPRRTRTTQFGARSSARSGSWG